MEERAAGNIGDRLEIALLFAALFAAAFVMPLAFDGLGTWKDVVLPGVPAAALALVGVALFRRRPALSAAIALVAAPAAVAIGIEAVEAPPGGEGVARELSLAVTGVAYFLGTARAFGGPAGRLPSGSAQAALLPASLALLSLGLVGASLAGASHYASHFGEGALEARFLGSSLSLVLGSVTMLAVGPALARAPRVSPRPPQQLVGRAILYASLAAVGLLLLERIS